MKVKLVIAAFLCCIALSGEAQAQDVWTCNDLQFNGCTGEDPTKICAIGSMDMGYSTQAYYNMRMSIRLVDVNPNSTYQDNYVVQSYNNYLPAYGQWMSYCYGTVEMNYF